MGKNSYVLQTSELVFQHFILSVIIFINSLL